MSVAQYYIGLRAFAVEETRRQQLAVYRRAAARQGYRGRMSFSHYGIHGRHRGFICVTIHPRSST